jgi:hypothetical protein
MPKKDKVDLILDDIKEELCRVVDETFASWIQQFYDQVYEEGIEEGEIIEVLRHENPKFNPWTETGCKKRRKLREERAKLQEAEEEKLLGPDLAKSLKERK